MFIVVLEGRATPVGWGLQREGVEVGFLTSSTCSPIGPGDAALKLLSKGKGKEVSQCSGELQRTPNMPYSKASRRRTSGLAFNESTEVPRWRWTGIPGH